MKKTVLLVDDDKIVSFLTANSIKKSPTVDSVDVVYNGLEAINFLEKSSNHPDFILLDIGVFNKSFAR